MRRLIYTFMMTFTLLLAGLPVRAEDVIPEDAPDVLSSYLYLVDAGNGQLIWSKNGTAPMYPASMTKMMTEIIAIEALPDLDETILITDEMMRGLFEANASMAGFLAGDEPTVRDLLYGAALPSGAECVNALAIRTDGSLEAFISHMNRKAQELGMTATRFTNPTGLHGNDHVSSCRDMEVLLAYCLANDTFREIFTARTYRAAPTASHPEGIDMESTVWRFLEEDPIPGLTGGKTGFTYPAGRCLASAAAINGMDLILITGKAPDHYTAAIDDARTVYGWCRDNLQRRVILAKGEQLALIRIRDAKDADRITVSSDTALSRDVSTCTDIRVEKDFPDMLEAPVEAGQLLGTVAVYENDVLLYRSDCYADVTIPYSTSVHLKRVIREALAAHPRPAAAGGLLAAFFLLWGLFPGRKRKKRKKRRTQ